MTVHCTLRKLVSEPTIAGTYAYPLTTACAACHADSHHDATTNRNDDRYIRRGSAHGALATCARGATPTHNCRGMQPEPVIVR